MEAFEKWWEKQEVSQYNPGAQFAYEEGWRAALEWVKQEAISLDERGDISRNIIEKELEDK